MEFEDFQAGISWRFHKLRNFIFIGVWISIILRWFLRSDWCNHLWFWKNHDNKISGQFMMNSSLHILTLKLWYWLTSIQIMYMLLAKSKNNNHLVFISTHTIVGLVPCSGSLFRLISILCISPKILCFVRPATNEIYWPLICLYYKVQVNLTQKWNGSKHVLNEIQPYLSTVTESRVCFPKESCTQAKYDFPSVIHHV